MPFFCTKKALQYMILGTLIIKITGTNNAQKLYYLIGCAILENNWTSDRFRKSFCQNLNKNRSKLSINSTKMAKQVKSKIKVSDAKESSLFNISSIAINLSKKFQQISHLIFYVITLWNLVSPYPTLKNSKQLTQLVAYKEFLFSCCTIPKKLLDL